MTILHKCTEIHWFSSGHHVHFTIQESGTKTNLLKVESVEKELSRGWEELSRHVACGTVTFHNRGGARRAAAGGRGVGSRSSPNAPNTRPRCPSRTSEHQFRFFGVKLKIFAPMKSTSTCGAKSSGVESATVVGTETKSATVVSDLQRSPIEASPAPPSVKSSRPAHCFANFPFTHSRACNHNVRCSSLPPLPALLALFSPQMQSKWWFEALATMAAACL